MVRRKKLGKVPRFAHPSELAFARLLDYYGIRWEYEPRAFVLRRGPEGQVEVAFRPDFYLPEFDLYIETTTKKPHLMDRKRRQIEALHSLYPDVRCKLLSRSDFELLCKKLKARGAAVEGVELAPAPPTPSPPQSPSAEPPSDQPPSDKKA